MTPLSVRATEVDSKTIVRFVVALVAASSAGVHAALVPDHFHEGNLIGAAFVLSALLLAAVAALVALSRPSRLTWASAAVVLAGVAVGYVLSRSTGIPVLLADREQLDPLGLITTGAETIAALAATVLALSGKERL
jgi:ABC-type Fe3+-siderophore transport system permease subunit